MAIGACKSLLTPELQPETLRGKKGPLKVLSLSEGPRNLDKKSLKFVILDSYEVVPSADTTQAMQPLFLEALNQNFQVLLAIV